MDRPSDGARHPAARRSKLDISRSRRLAHLFAIAATHPRLLLLLARVGWRFRARSWYRRSPFLPVPPAEYVDWRMHTAYGDEGAEPSAADLERYLRWALRMRSLEPHR